jgi:signal transduction histidine kinase
VKRWHATRRRWRHSIQWRLVTVFVLLALASTLVFVLGMQRVLRAGWEGYARPLVADYVDRLAAEIGSPPDAARAQALVARLPIHVRIDGPQVRFDSHPDAPTPHHWGAAERREFGAEGWNLVRASADGHRIRFGLALPARDAQPRVFGWLTLGLLLGLTLVAYTVVRRLLRPLRPIGQGVARFGAGDFATPIPPLRRDELGELAERINAMAAGLRDRLEAKRALLLAISHELRSPLTRARVNAELVPPGEHRDALLRDLAQMRDLIDDLLESERLAQGHAALQTEAVDLAALVRELVATRFADAGLTLDLDETLGPQAVDPMRLRLLLRNLIDNALRHGAGAVQPPRVALVRDDESGWLRLTVRDHGAGVSEEQLAHLAEPFYRTDPARARASGGVGLGLALCRLVAQAHGGQLLVRRAAPGLEVSMRWPRARSA